MTRARDIADSGTIINNIDNIASDVQSQINDRIQVANTAAGYSTLAQLANTNTYIASKAAASNPVITGSLSANGSIGVSGNVLKSDGSIAYWDAPAAGGVSVAKTYYLSSF